MKRIFAYLLCRKRKQKNNKMTSIPIVDDEEDEDEDEDDKECRYCDNDDCLYGGYIYDEELEKHKGKSYICIGCSTGVSLQEQEQEGIEVVIFTWEGKDYLKSIDNTIYDKSTWDIIGKWDPIKLELII